LSKLANYSNTVYFEISIIYGFNRLFKQLTSDGIIKLISNSIQKHIRHWPNIFHLKFYQLKFKVKANTIDKKIEQSTIGEILCFIN